MMRLLTRKGNGPKVLGSSGMPSKGLDVAGSAAGFLGFSGRRRRPRGFRLLFGRFRGSPRGRNFADARIACEDKVAGVERGFLEIRGIDGKKLPAGHFLAQQPDGPHMGKLRAQSWVMLFDCG